MSIASFELFPSGMKRSEHEYMISLRTNSIAVMPMFMDDHLYCMLW